MIDEILDFARFVTEWPSGTGKKSPRLVGRSRPVRWMLLANRIIRILCIPLGIASFFFLGDDTPWRFIAFAGSAILIAVATFVADTIAIRRGRVRVEV